MSFEVNVDSKFFTTKSSIAVKTAAKSLKIDGSVLYKIMENEQKEIIVSGKYSTDGMGALNKHNIFISFNVSSDEVTES